MFSSSELVGVSHGITLPGNRTFLFTSDHYWRLLPGSFPISIFNLLRPHNPCFFSGVLRWMSMQDLAIHEEREIGGGSAETARTWWSWETETAWWRNLQTETAWETETAELWLENCELQVIPKQFRIAFHFTSSSSSSPYPLSLLTISSS